VLSVAAIGAVGTSDARLSDARTPTAHGHVIADTTGLQTGLDGKVGTTDPRLSDARAPTAHGHPQSDVTGLGTSLAAKADLVGGLVPTAQIPAVATGQTVTVVSQAAMLALTSGQVQPGDVAIRSDQAGRRWLLAAADPSVLGSWIALEVPDAVSSVNSQQGAVILGKGDVGLGSVDNTADSSKPVSTAQQVALDAKAATTDARFPAGADIVDGDIAAAAGIAEAKLTLASDAPAGTPSRRSLGTGAGQALPGDHVSVTNARAPTAHGHAIADTTGLQAGLDAKVASATLTASGKGHVNHGATAATARPAGYKSVEWVGSVSPTNGVAGDTWVNTV
jgi:hypothetical protein